MTPRTSSADVIMPIPVLAAGTPDTAPPAGGVDDRRGRKVGELRTLPEAERRDLEWHAPQSHPERQHPEYADHEVDDLAASRNLPVPRLFPESGRIASADRGGVPVTTSPHPARWGELGPDDPAACWCHP